MPLLEIIGVVPTGKIFVIGLAFLQDEKKGSFEWALQCTKDLFNPNQIPEVIVTDREFALINAISVIFPDSYHMLCTRHIVKNVEAKAKKVTGSMVFSCQAKAKNVEAKKKYNIFKRYMPVIPT
ncbi:hypothetical protein AgCh_012812 [Apium graveolens]